MSNTSTGFVYILSNKTMPDLIKVGFTTGTVESRAKELYTTGVPIHFDIEYKVKVTNPKEWESRIHRELKEFRVNKEWFNLSPSAAIEIAKRVIGSGPIESAILNESSDINHIISEVANKHYRHYISYIEYSRLELLDWLQILIHITYKHIFDLLHRSSSFISLFGKINKDISKLDTMKSLSLKSLLDIQFKPLISQSEWQDQLFEIYGNNIHGARHLASVYSDYKFRDSYRKWEILQNRNIYFFDVNSNGLRSTPSFREVEEIASSTSSHVTSLQIRTDLIKDKILLDIVLFTQRKRDGMYDTDYLSKIFSSWKK